ncbi:unnamed protein product [Ectocarpus sp. 13 AM-2016]
MVVAAAKMDLGLETCSLRPAAFTLGSLCMAKAKAPKVARASSHPESKDDFVAAVKGETAGEAALRTSPPAPPLTLESTITVDTGSPKTVLRHAPPPAQHGPKTAAPALPSCPRALSREVFTYAEKHAPTCSSPSAPKALSMVVPAHANGGPPTRAMLPLFAPSAPDVCQEKEESQTAEAIPSTTSRASSAVDRSTDIVALTDREPIGPPPSAPSEENEDDDKPSGEQSSTDVCPVPADVRGDWGRYSAAGAHPKGAEAGEGTTTSFLPRSAVNNDDHGHDTRKVPASPKPLLLLRYGAGSSRQQEDEICLRSPEDDGGETSEAGDTVAGRYGKNVEDGGDMGGDGGGPKRLPAAKLSPRSRFWRPPKGFSRTRRLAPLSSPLTRRDSLRRQRGPSRRRRRCLAYRLPLNTYFRDRTGRCAAQRRTSKRLGTKGTGETSTPTAMAMTTGPRARMTAAPA